MPIEKRLVRGVQLKPLIAHADERGYPMEMLRCDDRIFQKFGQAYVSLNYPGVIRARHWHEKQADYWVVVKGMVKAMLYDRRPNSPTYGMINEFFLGEHNRVLLAIPPLVAHGYKTIGVEPSLLINFPTEPYDCSALTQGAGGIAARWLAGFSHASLCRAQADSPVPCGVRKRRTAHKRSAR
ncbi:MAG: dTDP-4-dehydrorhamnose 3,5-epimerase family protein [Fimbriimonadales bacterium]|nr:dTDP-4-dehydrorhamnose 3,5-epimerase family protein [Fimbriimonadales bacterium]